MLRHAGDTIVAVDRVIVEEEITVGIGGGERETVAQRRERNGGMQSDLDALMQGAIGISGGAWCPGEERQAMQLVPDLGEVERNVPKIGRATCRERVCQYVMIPVVAIDVQKTRQ